MTDIARRRPWYWEQHTTVSDGRKPGSPPGEELADLRRGLGREPGSVPQMWPYHQAVVDDVAVAAGYPPRALVAEHHALALYGMHQQSQPEPMHRLGVGLGAAALALRRSGRFSEEAVDRRVNAAATATSTAELVAHLRSLVGLLRTAHQPLDYTALLSDIYDWAWPERAARVRRRWGAQYYAWSAAEADPDTHEPDADAGPSTTIHEESA